MIFYPEILFKTLSQNRVELGLRIPKDLYYFAGHFPDFPVVPGVVQLHWAVGFAKDIFKISANVSQARQIKFSNLIRPLDELSLALEHYPEKYAMMYSYKTDQKTYASGRFEYFITSNRGEFTNDI